MKPTIVCLCGSMRFYGAFREANVRETIAGHVVLAPVPVSWFPIGETPEKKSAEELHKRKIDLADEILVLNVGGYIGESTRSEITYAFVHAKKIRYLEPVSGWIVTEGRHVMPFHDLMPHVHSLECWCSPTRDSECPDLIIHYALDGREAYERGERRPS